MFFSKKKKKEAEPAPAAPIGQPPAGGFIDFGLGAPMAPASPDRGMAGEAIGEELVEGDYILPPPPFPNPLPPHLTEPPEYHDDEGHAHVLEGPAAHYQNAPVLPIEELIAPSGDPGFGVTPADTTPGQGWTVDDLPPWASDPTEPAVPDVAFDDATVGPGAFDDATVGPGAFGDAAIESGAFDDTLTVQPPVFDPNAATAAAPQTFEPAWDEQATWTPDTTWDTGVQPAEASLSVAGPAGAAPSFGDFLGELAEQVPDGPGDLLSVAEPDPITIPSPFNADLQAAVGANDIAATSPPTTSGFSFAESVWSPDAEAASQDPYWQHLEQPQAEGFQVPIGAEASGHFLDTVHETLYPQDALKPVGEDDDAGFDLDATSAALEEASRFLFPETAQSAPAGLDWHHSDDRPLNPPIPIQPTLAPPRGWPDQPTDGIITPVPLGPPSAATQHGLQPPAPHDIPTTPPVSPAAEAISDAQLADIFAPPAQPATSPAAPLPAIPAEQPSLSPGGFDDPMAALPPQQTAAEPDFFTPSGGDFADPLSTMPPQAAASDSSFFTPPAMSGGGLSDPVAAGPSQQIAPEGGFFAPPPVPGGGADPLAYQNVPFPEGITPELLATDPGLTYIPPQADDPVYYHDPAMIVPPDVGFDEPPRPLSAPIGTDFPATPDRPAPTPASPAEPAGWPGDALSSPGFPAGIIEEAANAPLEASGFVSDLSEHAGPQRHFAEPASGQPPFGLDLPSAPELPVNAPADLGLGALWSADESDDDADAGDEGDWWTSQAPASATAPGWTDLAPPDTALTPPDLTPPAPDLTPLTPPVLERGSGVWPTPDAPAAQPIAGDLHPPPLSSPLPVDTEAANAGGWPGEALPLPEVAPMPAAQPLPSAPQADAGGTAAAMPPLPQPALAAAPDSSEAFDDSADADDFDDDLGWEDEDAALPGVPPAETATGAAVSQSQSEQDAAAAGGDEPEILKSLSLNPNQHLLLVAHGSRYALMAQTGSANEPEVAVLKLFHENPLLQSSDFMAIKEGQTASSTLYVVKLGLWQGVVSCDARDVKLQVEREAR